MAIARARTNAPIGEAVVPTQTVAASADSSGPHPGIVVLWIAVVAIVALVAWRLNERWDPPASTLPEGISIFALFFVLTLALERALEPIAALVNVVSGGETDKTNRDLKVAALATSPSSSTAGDAATAQAKVTVRRANMAVGMWGFATSIALLLSAATGAYFLRTLGIGGVADKRWLDILVTGFVIGAGTKPLHDLITNISVAKAKATDPAETH